MQIYLTPLLQYFSSIFLYTPCPQSIFVMSTPQGPSQWHCYIIIIYFVWFLDKLWPLTIIFVVQKGIADFFNFCFGNSIGILAKEKSPNYSIFCVWLFNHMSIDIRVWLPSILPMKWKPSKTSCGGHLGHSVHIPSSSGWSRLVEIWGLSAVMLRFPQCQSAENSLHQFSKNRHNFWTNIAIVMPFEI